MYACDHELTEAEETRNHELCTVADGVNSAVLDDNTLVGCEKTLKGTDDPAQIRFVALVVIQPLRIHDIVQSDHTLVLVHSSTAHTTELLHVRTDAEKKTKMNTQSTNVSSRLTADPENTKVSVIVELEKLALVDGSDTKLALDSRDKRRPLEESTGQGLQSASELGLATGDLVVETDNANIFLSGALLRLDQTSRTVDTNDQASSDLRIESTTVTGLVGPLKTCRFSKLSWN